MWRCRGWTGGKSMVRSYTPCALVPSPWRGKGKRGVSKLNRKGWDPRLTGRGGGPSRPTTGYRSHWFGTPVPCPPRMQWWLELTRVIASLLFTYLQVCEYGSFHFVLRRLARLLIVASASTLRSPSTDAKKGVKCRHSLRQAYRYFFFFSRSAVSRHFLGFWDW